MELPMLLVGHHHYQELLHVSQQQIYTSMAQYPRVKMNYNKL